jgi:ABC-type branched-subunit amino acid transport system ATPase component
VTPSEIVRQIERSFEDSNPSPNSTIVEVIVLPASGTNSKAAPARTLAPGRVVTRVEKAVESLGELGGQVLEASTLSAAHRKRLQAALAALRAQADEIEAALKKA